jgi:hydrophobe/amphiphile efflux-1 (HAE1) family protein/NodT family efflux transporter outer membrane factor (OMF) lipoprotein
VNAPTVPGTQEVQYFFIRRPVMAAVISIIITLLGVFAIRLLPIAQYPLITPPSVQVTAIYPGASAQDVAVAVAAPIEEQLSGLEGVLYYSSANSGDGFMNLQVFFDIDRDQDLAAVDVQNAVKLAEPRLPEAVRRNGITILKANPNILSVIALSSSDPRYDEAYLTNYLKLYVENELKRVPGVGSALTFGGLEFSMLLQLDPDRMAQLGVTVGDVAGAVQEQNTTNPSGRLGREPAPMGTELTIPVTTIGRLQTPEEFGDIVVRAKPDGSLIRVRDVGDVTLGAYNYDAAARLNGLPTAFALAFARSDANALAVQEAIVERLEELSASFPPGVTYAVPFDTTPFVEASIDEVVETLLIAMGLVALVVFLFLQSFRATLIPMLAVPVSVVGTFLGMLIIGFSINVLTLFALVLAIGIVVDDAIVVIENVERIMAAEGVSARVAADRAIRQVRGALIAIVLVLCAVFVPVGFMGGVTGALFQQFAITIVIAVVLSGLVALTLTPALCAILLKESNEAHTTGFFGVFNRGFHRVTRWYGSAVDVVIGRPAAPLAVFAVLVVLAGVLWTRAPSAFLPTEDKGYFAMAIQLPDGASLQRTKEVLATVEGFLREEEGVQTIAALAGLDMLSFSNQTSSAAIFVMMRPWEERGPDDSVDAVTARLNGRLFGMAEALGFAFNMPEIPGLGTTAGIEAQIQNRSAQDFDSFAQQVQAFTQAANQLPASGGLNSNFRANVPQLYVEVDRATAKARGVQLNELFGTLQALLSTLYINDFNLLGRTYRVQAEAQTAFRQTPADLGRLHVRGANDEMIPISALTRTEFRGGPTLVTRFNGYPSALLAGAPVAGASSGELMEQLDLLTQTQFASQGIGLEYSGQSFLERTSSGAGIFVFALGLIIVFLVLAAQYESFSIPFAILLGVPFGLLGALLGIGLRDLPADIYFQVGLITVVGLAAKNSILIVEFANDMVKHGHDLRHAAVEAGRQRLRPILMTSFAFILGVSPLLFAGGAGAASRHSMGTSVFAGMLFATLIGVFFIPLFFTLIRGRGRATSRPSATGVAMVAVVTAVSGCAVGPDYEPTPTLAARARVGAAASSPEMRAFLDSLSAAQEAAAQDATELAVATTALPVPASGGLPPDDLRWLTILQDTVLMRLVGAAVDQNRDLVAARARVREFRAEVGAVRAPLLPDLTLNTSAGRQQVAFGNFPPQLFTALTATGNFAWELDFWGETRRGVEAANADLDGQVAAERGRVLQIVSEMATGYLQLLALDQERALAEEALASRRETLDLARGRFQQGVTSELDVAQFEAQLAVPAVALAEVQQLQALQENALSELIGQPPSSIPRGGTLRQAALALTVPDSVSAELLARRPDVQQAERAFAAATARIGVADAARLPEVSIFSSYGTQASEPDQIFDSNSRIWSAQAGLSFRVYTGGELESRSEAARARADQAAADYERTVLTALRESSDALTAIRASRDQVIAEQTRTAALRRAFQLAELRYGSGISSYLEVLDAQRSLFDAELALTRAELRQLIAAVQLYKALGGTWEP